MHMVLNPPFCHNTGTATILGQLVFALPTRLEVIGRLLTEHLLDFSAGPKSAKVRYKPLSPLNTRPDSTHRSAPMQQSSISTLTGARRGGPRARLPVHQGRYHGGYDRGVRQLEEQELRADGDADGGHRLRRVAEGTHGRGQQRRYLSLYIQPFKSAIYTLITIPTLHMHTIDAPTSPSTGVDESK